MSDNRGDGWQDADAWLRQRAEQDERRYPEAFISLFVTRSPDPLAGRHTPNGSRFRITSRDYEGGNPRDG